MARLSDNGILVVDKPSGPTSHDVVATVRRTLGIRRVGHAGTLDPLASGVLVVMVGEAAKLSPFLALDDKRYEATVLLGVGTDTFDAEGTMTERAPLPSWMTDPTEASKHLAVGLAEEASRTEQEPPAFSAVKVGGRRAHRLARAGRAVSLAMRPVVVYALELSRVEIRTYESASGSETVGVHAPSPTQGLQQVALASLTLHVGKGYYVRSLARDLGLRVGLPAHLVALRRLASGRFGLEHAVRSDATRDAMHAALLETSAVASQLLDPCTLTAEGVARAVRGQRLTESDFRSPPPAGRPCAWLDEQGGLVAIGRVEEDGQGRVVRGFATHGSAR